MTQRDANPSVPEEETLRPTGNGGADAEIPESESEAEPESIPWTPARVREWNAYYDIYVVLAALMLVFVVSAVRVDESNPMIWSHLKAGELIGQQTAPLVTDQFSYTATGERWVNIPWLFQWGHSALYQLVLGLVPVDQNDPTANQESAEQIAVGVLIGINALARLLTAWIVLRIRRGGPGLWWSATCAAIALGAIMGPFGILPGGIAGPGLVTPGTWGMLLLAVELLLLHRAYNEGRARALYGLVPLFVLWANVDESFIIGLLILAAAAVGRILDGQAAESLIQAAPLPVDEDAAEAPTPQPADRKPLSVSLGLITLGLCTAACLVNPSTYRVFVAAASPVLSFFGPESELFKLSETSFFGQQIQRQLPRSWYWLTVYYLVVVAIGLASFLWNSRRFAWTRFLPFAVTALVWGVFRGYGEEFALVFATVLTLNGQEWYQDRFGTEGRLGAWWSVWSTGGRLVTLAALFFCVGAAITGWGKSPDQPRFGFGFDANDFPFEAADYLARRDDIKGNILNTSTSEGDALIWKAFPARRTFIDSRAHIFSPELLEEHRTLRNAIRDDDQAVWQPALDKRGISVVMIDSGGSPRTYERLIQSVKWIPFYDDGHVVMFGRADATEPDLTAFKQNRLEPELRAYKGSQPVPPVDRPPTPTTWLDDIFRNRLLVRPQSHTNSAVRWLQGGAVEGDDAGMPEPSRCLLAIREARTALSKNPDDWVAYRLLDAAYRILTQHETALLAGIPLTKENQARISMLAPNIEVLSNRFQQRATALNYAIQTTPPPASADAKRELQSLHLEIYQLFLQAGFLDLARDHLQAAIDLNPSGEGDAEALSKFKQQLEQLNQRVQQISDNMTDLQVERQAGPIEKAMLARSQGAPGLAIGELEEADRGSMSPTIVKPQLVDLYNSTGQPDRALELLTMGATEDPNMGTEPGMSFKRQGQVYLLLGNYLSAASLWQERAIPRLRFDRSMRALQMAQVFGRGDIIPAVNTDEAIPTLLTRQAFWSFDLAQALLESGEPDRAAEYFTQALKLVPDLPVRPIIAYYLERMGRPVPKLAAAAESASPEPMPAAEPSPPKQEQSSKSDVQSGKP